MAKWSSFTPDHGLTLGSLYHWAKAEGWPGPSKIPAPAEGETAKPPCDKDYLTHDGVLCRWVPMKVKGKDDELEWQPVPLANFDARAVEEVAQTIGASARRVKTQQRYILFHRPTQDPAIIGISRASP